MNDAEKLELAEKYFIEGWSLSVSMSKAGFKSNWLTTKIANHPKVLKMTEIRKANHREKMLLINNWGKDAETV